MGYVIVIAFTIFDIVLGCYVAIATKTWSSSKMRQGIINKGITIFALIFCTLIDYSTNYLQLPYDIKILPVIEVYLVIMEIGSILETFGKCDKKLYTKLKEILKK